MDVKKKLVELIQNAVGGCARNWAEVIADHLLANGATINIGTADTTVADNVSPTETLTHCQQWIPVTERLPETCGYPVLMVAVNKYGQKKIVKGFTNYECPVEFCTNEKEYDLCWHCWEVTHWMHLPEPPKGE